MFCAGPDSCALQVAGASVLWQLFLGQKREFYRVKWISSDASSRYNTASRGITALDAFWAGCGRQAACTLQTEAAVSNPATGGLSVRMLFYRWQEIDWGCFLSSAVALFTVHVVRCQSCDVTHLAGRCCTIALPGPAGVCAVPVSTGSHISAQH